MAKTTAQAFDEFKTKLMLTDAQTATVAGRRTATHGYLASSFGAESTTPLDKTLLIGSGARGTLIRPLDDIDVMSVFTNKDGVFEKYRYDSQAFLYRVRDALNNFNVKVVGARGQAVRLFYTAAPHVDIAPVFKWSGSGYALPNGSGGWITTDPIEHQAWLNRRNAELGYHLKPLIRMLKRWNNVHSKRLKSFHLEVLTSAAFVSIGGDSRKACELFFDYTQYRLGVSDPAGHSGDLSSYLSDAQRTALNSSLGTARDRAKKANEAEGRGDHVEAIRLWRLVFGNEFPTYG